MFQLFWFARRFTVLTAFFLLVLAPTPLAAQSGAERFYYFQGTRIPLQVYATRVVDGWVEIALP